MRNPQYRRIFRLVALFAFVISGAYALIYSPSKPSPSVYSSGDGTSTLELWHIQGAGGGPDYIEDSVRRFEVDHPGIPVETILFRNDPYKIAIRQALSAGTAPCVFPTWGGGPLYQMIQAGYVVDLTPTMNQEGYKDRFVSAAIDNVTYEGKIWGVPVENIAIAVFFYNKMIFERYGLNPPQTYDELLNIVDVLVENGITPFALANKTLWPGSIHYMYLIERLGGPDVFLSAANRQGGSFEDPVFIQAGAMLQNLAARGAFGSDFDQLNHDSGDSRAMLYSGEAAMELMGTWNIPLIRFEYPWFYENRLGFFPYPSITGGIGNPNNLIGSVGDQFYHVSTTCPYPQEAIELIQYLIDDEAVALRASYSHMPPIRDFTIDDPVLQEILSMVSSAPHIQNWYDQYLPPELGEVHKHLVRQLLDLDISPEEAAYTMEAAAQRLDAGETFSVSFTDSLPMPVYVYSDFGAEENLFVPEGLMGDTGNVTISEQVTDNPHSGDTAIQIIYRPGGGRGWAGVYWWNPPNGEWCTERGDLDLGQARRLTFWARGERGGELAEFKIGGLKNTSGKPCDTLRTPLTTRRITLTADWVQYEIDLSGADLSAMSSGFVWATNSTKETIIYLDDIRFE